MVSQVISVTEIARHFSDVLNRVRYQGQSFDIKRGKDVVAKIVPVRPSMTTSRFKEFLLTLPTLDEEDRKDFLKTIEETRESMKDIKNVWE
ncbi:MAG: hypothetical protein A2X77_01280 [Gammaproteobacteria bacterium GWE2_42_36]|nr:MAG: hypothetical protein A2X77_01280 [Gammaproteobacteria bacterium GWE2_42_36]HCU05469.1 antitoxin [Coxiellaceae bacterium]